jgi:hypothetical protein
VGLTGERGTLTHDLMQTVGGKRLGVGPPQRSQILHRTLNPQKGATPTISHHLSGRVEAKGCAGRLAGQRAHVGHDAVRDEKRAENTSDSGARSHYPAVAVDAKRLMANALLYPPPSVPRSVMTPFCQRKA